MSDKRITTKTFPQTGFIPTTQSERFIELGRRIVQARKYRHVSQLKLAAAVELGEAKISKLERGEYSIKLGELEAIALVLNADMAYFFEPFNKIKRV